MFGMGLLTKRAPDAVDRRAARVFKRGDDVYVRYATQPVRNRARLINEIERAGWKLEEQHEEPRKGLRILVLTFRRTQLTL